MFENHDFFQEDVSAGPGPAGQFVGKVGAWGLHAAKIAFLIYSGYHGIHATAVYRGESQLGAAAGIVGIVVIEVVLLSLYLAWHNGQIMGAPQMIAAGVTYAVGFTLACLGIVADSQLQAGYPLEGWLVTYLYWGLPIAPAIMALGALLTHELAPDQLRARDQAAENQKFAKEKFRAHIANQRAELDAAKQITNANLNARAAAAKQIAAYYHSDDVQDAIRRSALGSVPTLLRAIGVDPSTIPDSNGNGRLDSGDVAAFLEGRPDLAALLFGVARRRDEEQTAPAVEVEVIRNDAMGANTHGVELVADERGDERALYRVETIQNGRWLTFAGYPDEGTAKWEADVQRSESGLHTRVISPDGKVVAEYQPENFTNRPGDGR